MPPLLRLLRPKQWLKNVLVLVAPVAAGQFSNTTTILSVVVAFIAFSLVASALYAINDVRDAELDRRHPKKRNRPVASGQVKPLTALLVSGLLLTLGILLSFLLSISTGLLLAAYSSITLLYSFGLKSIPILELAAVASGFVIRAAVGGTATDLPLTNWFMLVALFGSLFIVSGKRFAELSNLGNINANATRPTNSQYGPELLNQILVISCTSTLVTYCIFAFEKASTARYGDLYEFSVVPFCLALLRYLSTLQRGGGEEPEAIFLKDRGLQVLGVIWALFFVLAARG